MHNPEFVKARYRALSEEFDSGDIDYREFERQLAMLDEDWDENGNPRFVEE